MQSKILIIAGSDSGGGAGIQGDIKTVTALGGYAATAITALTAQNTLGVFGIHEIPDDFIAQQIELVLSDIGAEVIKTGMLHRVGVIKTVAESLEKFKDIPLIIDPVMVAKGGTALLKAEAVESLKNLLFPRAFLVTPNIPEAEILAGMKISDVAGMAEAAQKIMELKPKNVLVKGGHLDSGKVYNVLAGRDGVKIFAGRRRETRNTHGTGCALASAIATFTAQKYPLAKAVKKALDYVDAAIKNAPNIGSGHGPLGHMV